MGLSDLLNVNNGLQKMHIVAYSDEDRKVPTASFVVQFNPTTFSRTYEHTYFEAKNTSSSTKKEEFRTTKPETITVELLFDATNSSPTKEITHSATEGEVTVAEEEINKDDNRNVQVVIDKLFKLLFIKKGDEHKPPYLKLAWGNLQAFKCVLKKMTVNYKLFDSQGQAIRATVNCEFTENLTVEEQAKEEEEKSPNLTHVRVMEDHLTLPLLAKEIYADPRYYIQLASINRITNLRKRGTRDKVFFPPFDKKSK